MATQAVDCTSPKAVFSETKMIIKNCSAYFFSHIFPLVCLPFINLR